MLEELFSDVPDLHRILDEIMNQWNINEKNDFFSIVEIFENIDYGRDGDYNDYNNLNNDIERAGGAGGAGIIRQYRCRKRHQHSFRPDADSLNKVRRRLF